jgi:hypothetical protein
VPQQSHLFWESPAIDGHGKDLRATLLQGLQKVRIGYAIFLNSDAKSLHRSILVQCRDDFNPRVGFRHGDVWYQAQCLERCLRLWPSGDDDDLLQGPGDVCQRISSLQHLEEDFGTDPGQQDQNIHLFKHKPRAKPEHGPVVLQGNRNLP